ncbi:MAG: hypothetical protein J5379_02735 [Clostridiales bacterium]|nr:hypothetical protein [Clostridiales bacterium]
MPEITSTPVSLKCKVCGGDLRNDYLSGACVCAHCGNKWSLSDLVPDYGKYSHVLEKINQAKDLLAGKAQVTSAEQAKLLYKSASIECAKYTDVIGSDLAKVCQEGIANAEKNRHYAMGVTHFEKKNYKRALSEFEKLRGYKDVDELIEQAKVGAIAERKKTIPLAIIVGMVIPAILSILLKEKAGFPVPAVIPVFIVLTAAISYAVYLQGTLATVIIVLSVVSAVPLILFMILAYGFHMNTGAAAVTSVVAPIAVIILLALKPERKD